MLCLWKMLGNVGSQTLTSLDQPYAWIAAMSGLVLLRTERYG